MSIEFPAALLALLDGQDLDAKVGETLIVIATGDDGWPLAATISVGELLLDDDGGVLLTLFAASRTSTAIAATGRALVLAVVDGAILRLRLELAVSSAAELPGRVILDGAVVALERDTVPYARVIHGIGFELTERGDAVARWREQLRVLEGVRSA